MEQLIYDNAKKSIFPEISRDIEKGCRNILLNILLGFYVTIV